jgi:ectoine hydroxylase-related dioxygenase (phytanoyl-CoA dioxygenase family)
MQRAESQLERDGYLILGGFTEPGFLVALRRRVDQLFALEGKNAGSEFKQEPGARRLANLVDKGKIFEQVIASPRILECVAQVLGREFKLSSLNARSAEPGSSQGQPLHCDAGAVPDERGFWVCNALWMLTDFTMENGSVRVIPGSHRLGRLPEEVLEDPRAAIPGEVLLTGKAGTVVVFNAHLWHGATANRTDAPRIALHAFYCRRDKPQQQYQRRLLRPEVQRELGPELRWLLALDDPSNDELSSRMEGRSGFLR